MMKTLKTYNQLFENRNVCNSDNIFKSENQNVVWRTLDAHLKKLNTFTKNKLDRDDNIIYCLKQYLSRGYDINYYNFYYPFLIMFANNYEVTKFLIDNGAYIDMKTKNGFTALMNAFLKMNYDVFELLIENDADLNMKTSDGFDAFDYIPNRDREEIIKYIENKYPEKYQKYLRNKKAKEFNL